MNRSFLPVLLLLVPATLARPAFAQEEPAPQDPLQHAIELSQRARELAFQGDAEAARALAAQAAARLHEYASASSAGHPLSSLLVAIRGRDGAATAFVIPQTRFVVQPGDTLARIARRELGDPLLWEAAGELNGLGLATQLRPGQWLALDPLLEAVAAVPVPVPVPAPAPLLPADAAPAAPGVDQATALIEQMRAELAELRAELRELRSRIRSDERFR